jgi:hypothetical protein
MWVKDMLDVAGKELRDTISDVGVLVFFVIVPLLYPLLYAYLYSREVAHEVPVVVVDDCRSATSREFLRKCDATADLKIISYCADMEVWQLREKYNRLVDEERWKDQMEFEKRKLDTERKKFENYPSNTGAKVGNNIVINNNYYQPPAWLY